MSGPHPALPLACAILIGNGAIGAHDLGLDWLAATFLVFMGAALIFALILWSER